MNSQKILIVDGDPSTLSELGGFLVGEPYEVWTAQDGPECLDILRKEGIDLAIVELYIEGVNGIALLKLVKVENAP